eukprot:TRINITY_DN2335_c0_g1_i1.p1 TRINITY_DN2335_c0_g1~~TRINITY_DN2335_c0_g1_i1.p1  ORF type:complete len:407 (-),score=76.00 TRINITY_DN2335_c0_g1_i1:72-1292(-)
MGITQQTTIGEQSSSSTALKFVFLSPHFPPWLYRYAQKLSEEGVVVLGLSDEPWENLDSRLKSSLTEYYRVNSMNDYEQLYRAMGHFIHKHGRIHFVESINEHWLETEARLRDDFNIPGYTYEQMSNYKKKSYMKKVFKEAGLDCAKGLFPASLEDALKFAHQVGYPLIAKPNSGVGAEGTHKLDNDQDLEKIWKPDNKLFLEEFIFGEIETYDGIVNKDGKIVFDSTFHYNCGIMEIVNNSSEKVLTYTAEREVPADLREVGAKAVAAFQCRSRFFHLEFFRVKKDNRLLPLEMNLRAPGGMSVDMWNFAHDIDCFSLYAKVIADKPITIHPSTSPYYTCASPRRNNWKYKYTHEELVKAIGPRLRFSGPLPKAFSIVMGDYSYMFATPNKEEIPVLVQMIQERV